MFFDDFCPEFQLTENCLKKTSKRSKKTLLEPPEMANKSDRIGIVMSRGVFLRQERDVLRALLGGDFACVVLCCSPEPRSSGGVVVHREPHTAP